MSMLRMIVLPLDSMGETVSAEHGHRGATAAICAGINFAAAGL
jgi:hypothetical protein